MYVPDGRCSRDVDLTGEGQVTALDVSKISLNYNNLSTDAGFNSTYDITCDDLIAVFDLSKIGFEWTTR